MAPHDLRHCGEESGEMGKCGAELDADDAPMPGCQALIPSKVNNDLGLYPVENGLLKCKQL